MYKTDFNKIIKEIVDLIKRLLKSQIRFFLVSKDKINKLNFFGNLISFL